MMRCLYAQTGHRRFACNNLAGCGPSFFIEQGHGVGLCQYGAKVLADHGYGYRTILGHYYSRVEIMDTEKGK
jgi:hypothetical protein